MRGDLEVHGDNSMSAETDDPLGVRYEVRVWPMKGSAHFGIGPSPFHRPDGFAGRAWDVAQRLLGMPRTGPGEEWFRVFASALSGTNGRRATVVKARSLSEALLRGLEMLEGGSFPQPGEPTHFFKP